MSVQALRRESSPSLSEDQMRQTLERQRAAFLEHGPPSYRERRAKLEALAAMLFDNQDRFVEAVSADFGNRAAGETLRLELLPSLMAVRHTIRHLRSWMRPDRRRSHWATWPSRARIEFQPLGVIGIISPWNYPIYLATGPLTGALAAGNRAMIKPSELTPETSALIAELIAKTYDATEVSVTTGGPDVARAFSSLPFDHLLFTGSTAIGRHVMRAASENLVPVTLELGGKSPTFIGRNFPIRSGLGGLLTGKLFNAGQTCVAPDYILVHESRVDELVAQLRTDVAAMYARMADNPEYTAIINERHRERLVGALEDARQKGATTLEINPGDEAPERFAETGKLPLTLLLDVDDDMSVMQDEIFGPLLPIKTYSTLDEAIEYVNGKPRPLVAYVFSHDNSEIRAVGRRVVSGALSTNATATHVAQDDIPFGGVGPSGIGHYHAREGFRTFSHQKAVYQQLRPNLMHLIAPPYEGAIKEKLLEFLLRFG